MIIAKVENEELIMHVLIDASNVNAIGPRVLVLNLLPALMRAMFGWQVTLFLPNTQDFMDLPVNIQTRAIYWKIGRGKLNDFYRLKRLYWDLPRMADKLNPDVVLTLGDLGALRLHCPHVIFLHNSYFVYSRSEVNNFTWPLLKYVYIIKHFTWIIRSARRVIVQTPVMAERLARRYSISPGRIVQIAQPVPQNVLLGLDSQTRFTPIENCTKPVRLLFLSVHYPHKNHAILPSVAKELRRRGLASQVHIFTTLDENQDGWCSLQKAIEQYADVITNLGRLPSDQVADALRSSSALFLPTLAESYGLIYLEAMACGVPILTSDRDFARWMCRDLAFYFDPFDSASIVDAVDLLRNNMPPLDYSQKAKQRMESFPKDWDEVAHSFVEVLLNSAGVTHDGLAKSL